MAYISDEELDKKEGMNVLNPQDTQIQKSEATPAENANIQASGQSGDQTQANKKNVGTGFTNLKKYTEANKPAAAQMAKSITGNVQSQAANIGQQLKQKEDQYKQQINQNQQQLTQAQQFGQQALQKAAQGTVSEDEAKRFQALTSGQESYANAPQLDLQKEQIAAQNLAKQVGNVSTDEGRAALLRNTFANKGQQYTTGQQNLDRLILGGTADARKQVIQGLAGIDKPILQQAQQIGEAGQGMVSNLQAADLANREALKKQLGEAQTGTETDIQAAYEAAKAQEATGIGKYESFLKDLTGNMSTDYKTNTENVLKNQARVAAINQENPNLDSTIQNLENRINLALPTSDQYYMLKRQLSDANRLKNEKDTLTKSLIASKNKSLLESPEAINKSIEAGMLSDPEKTRLSELQNTLNTVAPGVNVADILKGSYGLNEGTGVSRDIAASLEQRARANALAQLSGGTPVFNTTAPEFRATGGKFDLDTATSTINDLIKKYNPQNVGSIYSDKRLKNNIKSAGKNIDKLLGLIKKKEE